MGCLKLVYDEKPSLLKVVKGDLFREEKGGAGMYRYGFNGQEKDDEIKGAGNSIEFKERIYDPRIGKFLSVDPLASDFPWNTPYAFAENRPIDGIDFEGLEYTSYLNKREYKSVNSAVSVAENFNSFLYNVGANIYNGASTVINTTTSTAVNTYKNGASNTAHKIAGKAQQAYHSVKQSAVAAKNYHVNTPATRQLKDAGAALTNLSNYELPAEAILVGGISKLKFNFSQSAASTSSSSGGTAFRYITEGEAQAVKETGLLRGGREGETFFTKDLYKSGTNAQKRLSLPTTPTLRLEFETLNSPSMQLNGNKVKPDFGQPGGGSEFMTTDPVKVKVVNIQPLKN